MTSGAFASIPAGSVDEHLGARIFGNAGILVGAQVVSKLLGAVLAIVAARLLGVADYGLYMFATTFGMIFGLLTAFGLAQLVTREVARDLSRTGQTLGNVLLLEVVLTIVTVLAMVVTLQVLDYPPRRLWIVVIVGSTMVLNSVLNVITAFFRAHQRMELEAVTRIVFSVLNLGVSLAVLLAGYGIVLLALVQLAVFAITLALGTVLAIHKLARPVFSSSWSVYRRLLLAALPFALSSMFIFVYDGTAPIFLSLFHGDVLTGLYAGATNFVRIFGLLPASLMGAVLPALSQLWPGSPAPWLTVFHRSLKYLLIAALPIAVGLALVSEQVVLLFLGSEYAGSASILQMVAWLIIVVFLNHGLTAAMISINREKTYLRIVGVTMVVNVAANLALIPRWAAYGAVASSLLTEGVIMLLQIDVFSRAGLRTALARLTLKPLASVAVMALVVHFVAGLGLPPGANLAAEMLVGGVVYVSILLLLRTFEADEIEQAQLVWQRMVRWIQNARLVPWNRP
jgi:O-antigen/teichoic acid export membrane protein